MSDEDVAQFTSITSATPSHAVQYLRLTEGDVQQAIMLYFENPDLATSIAAGSSSVSQPQAARHTRKRKTYNEDENGVIHIDSDNGDDDEMDMDDDDDVQIVGENTIHHPVDEDADAEMARRLQQEMYSGQSVDPDSVRAPIERVRETLVGGDDYDDADVSAIIQERLRRVRRQDARPGIFNQRDAQSSVWVDDEPAAQSSNLSFATGGASDRSTKANSLAEMFRPPFEIISRLTFDAARDEGKEQEKWLLVNIQDPSIFDCQVLNRDLWKNSEVKETIKANFIFLQYSNDDPRGQSYVQYYFANARFDQSAYPHIAIVDPRTGEQVKTWSGSPPPNPSDFLMQLYEFLDRYSLHEDAKNPVAKRKADRKELAIERMTEEQMLEMALQNSLASEDAGGPSHEDPDELTKSITLDKGKEKACDSDVTPTNGESAASPFAKIPGDHPHTEPANDPTSTTRIQFRYSGGRTVRRFSLQDPVQRIYEWLKAEPLQDTEGQEFDIIVLGKNLINSLDSTIEEAGLKNASVMVEFSGGDE